MNLNRPVAVALVALAALLAASTAAAHDPAYTAEFDRARCSFTSTGNNPYFPLWPGHAVHLEGEEDGAEIELLLTILPDTQLVDGIVTRVFEEREMEDGELVEVSRNFVALCRETGDVWYFGEDVDNYEDGEIVDHDGSWRAGVDGNQAGVLMPGTPVLGARFYQEQAPGIAEDRGEVTGLGGEATVPAGTFDRVLTILDTDALDPEAPGDLKRYAYGVGLIVDETIELTEITPPPCQPDATTHCLQDGRFKVTVAWETPQGSEGAGQAILPSADSGEFWFFDSGNTELLVKVLDACSVAGSNRFWVFAAGLTHVGVTLTVEDTLAHQTQIYSNPVGTPFAPVLDTAAFATCP